MTPAELETCKTLPSVDGAGTPEGAGAVTAFWGEAAWTARDLHDAELALLAGPDDEPAAPVETPQPVVRIRRRRGTGKLKAVLTLLMLCGVLSSVLPGTLASFSAETANPGNTLASGTLTLSNTVDSGNACFSNEAPAVDNVASCDTAITFSNVAPGVSSSTATALISVKNTGSIDASELWLWAPSVTPTLTQALTQGSSVATLHVTALATAVPKGKAIVLRYKDAGNVTHTQTFYASAAAAANDTTIGVVSQDATYSFPSGTSATTVQVLDCYDQLTSAPPAGAPNATYGTQLNYNSTAGNPMCGAVLLYVQEVTGMTPGNPSTQNYCWTGLTYGNPADARSTPAGMCVAPISVTLSSDVSGTIAALPVSELNGNIRANDQIVVTPSSGVPQTFTASTDVYAGATSIPVTSQAVSGTLSSGTAVSDSSTDALGPLAKLNADNSDTLTNFDTLTDQNAPLPMPQVQANGQLEPSTTAQLPHDTTRTFLVGVYMPNPTGSNQNPLQGLFSTFSLTWHVDQ